MMMKSRMVLESYTTYFQWGPVVKMLLDNERPR